MKIVTDRTVRITTVRMLGQTFKRTQDTDHGIKWEGTDDYHPDQQTINHLEDVFNNSVQLVPTRSN